MVGMGIRAVRPAWVNGRAVEVGYLGGLRSLTQARGGLGLAQGFFMPLPRPNHEWLGDLGTTAADVMSRNVISVTPEAEKVATDLGVDAAEVTAQDWPKY